MVDVKVPEDLRYTEQHEWVRDEGQGVFAFGITDFAQDALGDITYLELPDAGVAVTQGEPCGVVESVKTYSDVYAPLSGEVVAANEALADEPEMVNADPYGEGWLARIRASDSGGFDALLDAAAYRDHLDAQD